MSAPQLVLDLVQRFEANLDSYRSGAYRESQLRQEFVNPFFKALGWDVYNEKSYAEAFKEVVHEDALKIGGATKAPDYSFRIGGTRKFFVEAKKPSVDIAGETSPAYQLRRYAWSAKLPLSILTDFEEFAVYDTRVKPARTDKASTARVLYLAYSDYPACWDEIASIFSPDAIQKGSFDKYAETTKRKKGTAEVDDAFLAEIESWRSDLARVIALRNTALSQRDLNFVLQATVDRIIFLRICEDRGIEPYGRLQALLNGDRVYPRLFELFQRADERYNSGLFHFAPEPGRPEPPDTLSRTLDIDDKVLRDILRRLYYPESPYEFSVLPADILGQVYEQFLGKIIRLTPGHRAVVEEKPEVRKAGGVYYTPTYIVDYIVAHTLGPLLGVPRTAAQPPSAVAVGGASVPRGTNASSAASSGAETPRLQLLNPKQAAKLRILDPACGSGSFLLGAYQHLLDWHLSYYTTHDPEKWAKGRNPAIFQGPGGPWRLTLAERKRILLNNLYGVDIDPQAVEVTKLSLLLKVLEGASREVIEHQLKLFHDRALPDLAGNIKCGNSLIGPDFYKCRQKTLFDEEESFRVNVFDWKTGFPGVFEAGGFDVVIGNPPYIKEYVNHQPFHDLQGTRLARYYQGKMDLWYIFACLAIDLLKPKGLHSFIATSNWITSSGASILRQKVLSETQVLEFVDFGDYRVFEDAGIQTMVYVLRKSGKPHEGSVRYCRLTNARVPLDQVISFLSEGETGDFAVAFEASIHTATEDRVFTFVDGGEAKLLRRIQATARYRLKSEDVGTGIDVHQDFVSAKHLELLRDKRVSLGSGIFVISDRERKALRLTEAEKAIVKPYFTTTELRRYYAHRRNRLWVIYTDANAIAHIKEYPHLKAHLDRFAGVITSDNRPYGLHRPRDERFFLGAKIISLRKTDRPHFTYTDFPCYVSQTFFVLKPTDINLKYLLGVLNSRVCHFWLDRKGKKQGTALQVDKAPLLEVPIPAIAPSGHAGRTTQEDIVRSVDRMVHLSNRLTTARTAHEQAVVGRQIEATEREIDRLVYELYGLSDEEIKIVEEAERR